jgi:hypothetical protein
LSTADEPKIDVRERGAHQQSSDRRLFVQLQAFAGCADPKPFVRALEVRGLEAVPTRT